MLKHDQARALKVRQALTPPPHSWRANMRLTCRARLPSQLFTDPKQTVALDTRDLFGKMSQVDSDAADRFLEMTVLQERDTVRFLPKHCRLAIVTSLTGRASRMHDCMLTSSSGTSAD